MCKCANVQMCKSIFQNSQQNNLYYILYYNIIYNINNNLKVTLQNANRICTFAHLHICTKLLENSFSYLDIGYHASFVNVDASILFVVIAHIYICDVFHTLAYCPSFLMNQNVHVVPDD